MNRRTIAIAIGQSKENEQQTTEALQPLLSPKKEMSKNPFKSSKTVDEDDTVFDDSFVVRRKQAVPDGEEDSRSTMSGNKNTHRNNSRGSSSRRGGSHSDNDSNGSHHNVDRVEEDEDAASLAELTAYGSGVDYLHPHHKKRGGGHRSSKPERRSSEMSGSDVDSYVDQSRHRSSRHREESGRRRKHHSRSQHEEEEFYNEGGNSVRSDRYSSSSRSNHHRSSRRSSSGSSGRGGALSSIINPISNFFEGVSLKTVLLCMLGMTMIMKLNKPPPPPKVNHGMVANRASDMAQEDSRIKALISSNSLRGTPLVANANKENAKDESEDDDDVAEVVNVNIEGGSTTEGNEPADETQSQSQFAPSVDASLMQPPPPPPMSQEQPLQQQQLPDQIMQSQSSGGAVSQATLQQFDPTQQGYAPQPQQQQGFNPAQQQQFAPQQQQQNLQMQQNPQISQQGYYVAQQQQQQQLPYPQTNGVPGVASSNGYADPNTQTQYQSNTGGYAVGQQSTYNQSPLQWQQQQMAQQQGTQFGGGVPQQQQQFGASLDASQMAPPQTATTDGVQQPAAAEGSSSQQAPDQAQTTNDNLAAAVPLVPPPAPSSLLNELNNFKDAWDPHDKTDIPMFWHIPKAGGSSIKDAMGGCHRFVQATEFGVSDGHIDDTEVAIVYPAVPGVADTDRSPFVNIDSTTVEGIQRAKSMGFADAQLANVVVSPFVFETNELFTQTAKGRLFSVFRHPIDRAVSMFYYIRVADWEPSYKPELKDWTLEQYATSDIVENNWMTRQLSNQLGGELTEDNLKKAMEVVQTKFLVGLMTKIEPSMTRFEKAFRWTYHVNPPNQEKCRERLMSGGSNSNKKNKKPLAEGDPAWDLLAQQNNFDLQLYGYIETLFDEQEQFVAGMPDDFRNVDGTCCKCDPPTFPPEGFTCPQAVKNG